MGKPIFILIFTMLTSVLTAQVNELGLLLGGSNHVGDVGSSKVFRPFSSASGLIYKFNKTPRIAYRASLSKLNINPDDADSYNEVQHSFENSINKSITELSVGIEINFFEYNLAYRGQERTPYLFLGLAAIQFKAAQSTAPSVDPEIIVNYENERSLAIPFGIGYKTRLYGRFALAIETRVQYTFTDNLDDGQFISEEILAADHPNKEKFNNSATNDWYTFTGISLVYTFGRPACYNSRIR
ncbi:type IX secretion system protein PorG [Flavicella sediminum]|uniref:type IX secretion system protein PorG n=1 Tax=Flavicella sediminum TaxID=2585141 RepID=UPI00111D9A28|nr:DUF6089 family protein [Flavicella sediminum]